MKKHKYHFYFLGLILALLVVSPVTAEQDPVRKFINPARPLVIAHRGASSLAPENTLAAIEKAIALEVDLVEIDVHLTRDGELVVIHDPTIDRTTNGKGAVRDYTLDEIRQFDAGSWFNSAFAGERIPTLAEVLGVCKDKTPILLELKGPQTEIPTVELIKKFAMDDQVIIQSFDSEQIAKAKQAAPHIPTVWLSSEPQYSNDPVQAALWLTHTAKSVGASGIGIRRNWFTPQLLAAGKREQMAIFVWTVDKQGEMKQFINHGVQGIITNRPQDLQKLPSFN